MTKCLKLKSLRVEELKSCYIERSSIINSSPLHRFISSPKAFGFTMAEILLSLTIIGVVAAITLPSLTGNINERTWNTQKKALYSRFSQAIALMPAINGYGNGTVNATETFVNAGLSKVLKINNICATEYQSCGVVETYTNMGGIKKSMPTTLYSLNGAFSLSTAALEGGGTRTYSVANTNATAFETANGETIMAYYNPTCRTEYNSDAIRVVSGSGFDVFGFPVSNACLNLIFDLNGKKGPNTVGKDIGYITIYNATDSHVVMPLLSTHRAIATNVNLQTANAACANYDRESRIPNIQELSSIFINKDLSNVDLATTTYGAWSTSVYNTNAVWVMQKDLLRRTCGTHGSRDAYCVKR